MRWWAKDKHHLLWVCNYLLLLCVVVVVVVFGLFVFTLFFLLLPLPLQQQHWSILSLSLFHFISILCFVFRFVGLFVCLLCCVGLSCGEQECRNSPPFILNLWGIHQTQACHSSAAAHSHSHGDGFPFMIIILLIIYYLAVVVVVSCLLLLLVHRICFYSLIYQYLPHTPTLVAPRPPPPHWMPCCFSLCVSNLVCVSKE